MKPLFIISCPIDCYAGYGSRSRDLVKAIIELDKYDVKILPQRWGGTPWGFIEKNPDYGFADCVSLCSNTAAAASIVNSTRLLKTDGFIFPENLQ